MMLITYGSPNTMDYGTSAIHTDRHHPHPPIRKIQHQQHFLRQQQLLLHHPFKYNSSHLTRHVSTTTTSTSTTGNRTKETLLFVTLSVILSISYFSDVIIAYVPVVISSTKKYKRFQHHTFRLSSSSGNNDRNEDEVRIVIIGSGWAGLSAADALLLQSQSPSIQPNGKLRPLHIHLLEASPQVGGLASGWKSKQNKSVEGGLHGFWREYRNTFRTIERICESTNHRHNNTHTTVSMDDILTPYTPSVLYSRQSGRVAYAPVMIDEMMDDNHPLPNDNINKDQWMNIMTMIAPSLSTGTDPKALLRILTTFLPAPLDIAIGSEFSTDSQLTWIDRISALNLLSIWANFDPSKVSSWDQYDDTSADTLFRGSAKISDTLYSELVEPLLAVLPMCPGYDCSAAAALSCFHAFALCRKGAFDVRWCRGTITDKIFTPWIQILHEQATKNGNKFCIRNNAKVTSITEATSTTKKEFVVSVNNNDNETMTCDAIIFAVGIGGAQKLRAAAPPLLALSSTKRWDQLRAISCLCVRLFLDSSSIFVKEVILQMEDSPVAVCGPNILLPELCETGFCIYDLQRLQDEFIRNDPTEMTVIEVDYYRALDDVINLPNDEIADLTLRAIAKVLKISTPLPTRNECVLDVSVVRARNAVSHFSVGSASCAPSTVKLREGLYICGDWIDRKGHASWSTEKAVVTGRQAAIALASDFNIVLPHRATQIIPAAPDTPQLAALRKVNTLLRTNRSQ